MKLNLKSLKKVKVDSTYAHFKDARGNEIRVSHKTLSPKMRAELDALPLHLADGGEVKSSKGPAIVKKSAEEVQKGASESGWQPKQLWENLKEGLKKPQSMYDGGDVLDIAALDKKNSSDASQPAAAPVAEEAPMAPTASDVPLPEMVDGHLPRRGSAMFNQMLTDASNPQPVPQDALRAPAGPAATPDLGLAANTPAPGATPPPANAPAATLAPEESDQAKAFKMQQEGLQKQYDAQVVKSKADAAIAKQTADAQQTLATDFNTEHKRLQDEQNSVIDDIKAGHIDQDRLWANRSTPGKIATVIGLIAGGIATKAGEENPALKVLNQQIDRDIEEQKANLHQKNNILGALTQQMGSLKSGVEASRALQLGIAASKMEEAAATAASPMAKANLLMNSGLLKERASTILAKEAAMKTFNNVMSKGATDPALVQQAYAAAAKFMSPQQLKDIKATEVPGVGWARTPGDAEELKAGGAALSDAQHSIKRLLEINKTPFKSMSPQLRAEAESLKMSLIGSTRASFFGNRFNETELHLMQGLIPDVAKITSWDPASQKKLETLNKSLTSKFMGVAKSKGVQIPNQAQEDPAAKQKRMLQWAKENPNDKRSKVILNNSGQ